MKVATYRVATVTYGYDSKLDWKTIPVTVEIPQSDGPPITETIDVPWFNDNHVGKSSRRMPITGPLLIKAGLDPAKLREITVKIAPEQLSSPTGSIYVQAVLKDLHGRKGLIFVTRRQTHFVFVYHPDWTGTTEEGMNMLGPLNTNIPFLKLDEKSFTRVSAVISGNPAYGEHNCEPGDFHILTEEEITKSAQHLVDNNLVDVRGLIFYAVMAHAEGIEIDEDKKWLVSMIVLHQKALMDGSIYFDQAMLEKRLGKRLVPYSNVKVTRVLLENLGIGKGHGIVVPNLGVFCLIPHHSFTKEVLPTLTGWQAAGIAKGTPVCTDRQMLINFPSIDFEQLVLEYWVRVNAVIDNREKLLAELKAVTKRSPDEEISDEELETTMAFLAPIASLPEPRLYPALRQNIARLFNKGGEILDRISEKGRVSFSEDDATYGYIEPDMTAFDPKLRIFRSDWATLEEGEVANDFSFKKPEGWTGNTGLLRRPIGTPAAVSLMRERKLALPKWPNCVLMVSIFSMQEVLVTAEGADLDDLFISNRRAPFVKSLIDGTVWVPPVPEQTGVILESKRYTTPPDNRKVSWGRIIEWNIQKILLPTGKTAEGYPTGLAGIGLLASTIGCELPVIRNLDRWLETGLTDIRVSIPQSEMGVPKSLYPAVPPELRYRYLTVDEVIIGSGKRARPLRHILQTFKQYDVVVKIIFYHGFAELFIDWGNGKVKFGETYIHIVELFDQLLKALSELGLNISPRNGFTYGQSRQIVVRDVDDKWDGQMPKKPYERFNILVSGDWVNGRCVQPAQLQKQGVTPAWYTALLNPPLQPGKRNWVFSKKDTYATNSVIYRFKQLCSELADSGRLEAFLCVFYNLAYLVPKKVRVGRYTYKDTPRFPESQWLRFWDAVNLTTKGVIGYLTARAKLFGANLISEIYNCELLDGMAERGDEAGPIPLFNLSDVSPTPDEIQAALQFHLEFAVAGLKDLYYKSTFNSIDGDYRVYDLVTAVLQQSSESVESVIIREGYFSDKLVWLPDMVGTERQVSISGTMAKLVRKIQKTDR